MVTGKLSWLSVGISVVFLTSVTLSCSQPQNSSVESSYAVENSSKTTELSISDCSQFQNAIDKTYDFEPSKLTPAQKTAKSKEMDAVWEKVKADPKNLAPCLKAALESPTANSFFKFDGSTLLFDVNKSDETKKILIKSYADTDLIDVDLRTWIAYIARFGLDGFDTSAAGETWLNEPNPFYYLPEHGTLKVDKEIGALVIYGSMDEGFATPSLAKLAAGTDRVKREIAVRLLVDQATPESFRLLRNLDQKGLSDDARNRVNTLLTKPNLLVPREGKPKISREQYLEAFQQLVDGKGELFMKLASDVSDGEKDAIAVLKKEDIPLVRKARRFWASTGTPHAPEWYKSFTLILMAMVWDRQLIE